MSIILGIDPGSRVTGYGVISYNRQQPSYLTCGCIRIKSPEIAGRLKEIVEGVQVIIDEYQPTTLAIEQVFVSRNAGAALKLGQARGAAIVAAVQRDLQVYEYAPNQIKQAVTGQGHADKNQMQQMMKMLLGLSDSPASDAADALAVAICHAHSLPLQQRLAAAASKGMRR